MVAFLLALASISLAQPINKRKDWYFGRYASIHFNAANQPSFADNNPLKDYEKLATAYFKNGTFAFVTDGTSIYDQNKTKLASNGPGKAAFVQVVNHSDNDSLFNIIISGSGGVLHSVYNAYSNKLIKGPIVFEPNATGPFVMMKHCYAIGFWVVVPVQGNKWQSHYLSGSSIQKGQESPMPIAEATKLIEVTANYKGDKIAASTYAAEGFVTVYDFDSKCGTVSNEKKLKQSTTQIAWDYPLGLDFSPNNQFLYVCYSVAESQLVQYDMSDLDVPFVVATGTFNFDDILMAPDGRAYLNRHVDGNPSRKIDILQSPNQKGAACGYQENAYQLQFLTSGGFQLPPFINAYEANYCEHNVREFQSGYAGIPCVGNTLDFFTVYPNSTFTSAKWVIDYNGIISTETGKNISIPLNEEGQLKVLLIKGFCNLSDTIRYELDINSPPTYSITNDTTVCFGETLNIEVETDATKVLWSTGNDNKTINVAAGLYTVQLSNGACSITDSVSVTSHPPLSILLGDNYYICENENELIKLDAGKGFVNYLWHPTNDTTQWIIVNRVGDYFVVVDDFRGCKGDKGTKVDTRCNLVYFVPNAFSPNGDGKNDNFTVVGEGIEKLEMQIYNRWGELIFKSNSLAGWSGNNAQEGVYTYLIKVEGFKNKKTIFYHLSGNVTLLK